MKRPSEYLAAGRLFVSCESNEKALPHVLSELGDDFLVYASDYAHYDCLYPESVRTLQERSDVSEKSKEKLLGNNAARLYGLA